MRQLALQSLLLFLCCLPPFALSWGSLGHRTVAYLAAHHMSPAARQFTASLLADTDISDAAIWPDWYKNTTEGKTTFSWHFVDAQGDPPAQCSVDYDRDCAGARGCILSAIGNMTRQVMAPSVSAQDRRTALIFLLHLFGDLHQPLHNVGIARGGNDIPVLFDGVHTELHFVWDVLIPVKRANSTDGVGEGEEKAVARDWASKLYRRRVDHGFSGGAQDPLGVSSDTVDYGEGECTDIFDPLHCIMAWAKESNSVACEYVMREGADKIRDSELGDRYYEAAVPVVDDLVSKAGSRLASWIDAIAREMDLT